MSIEVQEHIGYCVKCRGKSKIKGAQKVEINARGGKTRPAIKGTCVVCDTKMMKMLSTKPPESVTASHEVMGGGEVLNDRKE